MNQKILSISVAAFNVEAYIDKLLQSIIDSGVIEDLEIFVIDDGGSDSTLTIARQYESKYPNSVFAVHKENGGWGSTVNWSVQHAKGKYFKIVDGDDWIQSRGLKGLVDFLKTETCEAVVTHAERVYPNGKKQLLYPFCEKFNKKTIEIDDALPYADVAIWGYTFLTAIVKEKLKSLPEKSFYTDRLFLFYILSGIKKISYLNQTVYFYRVGIDEQSTSIASIRRHYKEAMEVDLLCSEKYEVLKLNENEANPYLLRRLSYFYAYTVYMILMLPFGIKNLKLLIGFENDLRSISKDLYEMAGKVTKKVKWLRKTNYIFYFILPIYYFILNLTRNKRGFRNRKESIEC